MHRVASILAAASLIVGADIATAGEKCTSMCHLFDAYALAKVCPNLTLDEAYTADYRAFLSNEPFARQLKADAMRGVSHAKGACKVCEGVSHEDREGTVCQYLKGRPGSR